MACNLNLQMILENFQIQAGLNAASKYEYHFLIRRYFQSSFFLLISGEFVTSEVVVE